MQSSLVVFGLQELVAETAPEHGSLGDAKRKYTMLEFALLHFRNSPYRYTDFFAPNFLVIVLPSVLWHYWLGAR